MPPLVRLRYSISQRASSEDAVTTFCMAPPNAVSTAVSYFCSVRTMSAKAPLTRLPTSGLVLATERRRRTESLYPSKRFFKLMYNSRLSRRDAS